jgi:hypothetical protein
MRRVGNFASRGIIFRCPGLRAIADVFGDDYAKVALHTSGGSGDTPERADPVS